MIFGKRYKQDLKNYIARDALLELLLRGRSIEEVITEDFISNQKIATKPIQILEFILLLLAGGILLFPLISFMDGNSLGANSLLFIVTALFPVSFLYLLSNVRKENTLRSYSSSARDSELFDRLLTYWEALRLSNLPVLARKTQGIMDIGNIYSADAGILILLGQSPDDWKAIRRSLVPNCPLFFPSPSTLGLNFSEEHSENKEKHLESKIEKQKPKTTSEQSEESIRMELNRLNLEIRNSADLRNLLAKGNVELFNTIASITQRKAANYSEAKEDVVLRVIKCIRHSIENNRKTWPGGFSFSAPDGRELKVSSYLYEKICSGKSSIDKWLQWTSPV